MSDCFQQHMGASTISLYCTGVVFWGHRCRRYLIYVGEKQGGSVLSTRGRGYRIFLLCLFVLVLWPFSVPFQVCWGKLNFLGGMKLLLVRFKSRTACKQLHACMHASLCLLVLPPRPFTVFVSDCLLHPLFSGITPVVCLKHNPKAGGTGKIVQVQEHGGRSA